MRPVSVFANGPEASIEHLRGQRRQAPRAMMVLLPAHGLPRPGRPRIGGSRLLARIAALLERAGSWGRLTLHLLYVVRGL